MKTFLSRHKRPLRLCLSLCIMAVLAVTPCIPSKAAVSTNVPGLTWSNDHETKNIPITMRVPVTDCEKSYSTYYYDTFYEGDFYFNFYASGNVTPYLSTNLNYEFSVSPSTALNRISIKSASYTYSLIVAGAEYALSEKGGWLNLISANVINSYITLKVHFAGIIRLEKSYHNYQEPLIEFNSTLGMSCALVTWNCHENTDTVHENYKMLQQLVKGNEGIKGAIDNQTNVIQGQTDNIMNGYDSSQGNSSLGSFNEGMGKLEDAQSSVTDSVYDKLDDLSIPTGGIGDMVAGLTATAPIVSSMLQAMFQASGDFTIIMTVTLILTIVCMLLGIAKYFVR